MRIAWHLQKRTRKENKSKGSKSCWLTSGFGRLDHVEDELLQVMIVQEDVVLPARLLGDLPAYPHLRRQADDGDPDVVVFEGLEGLSNVPWIAGCEGAKDDQHFPTRVGRHVLQRPQGQLQAVLQGGLSFAGSFQKLLQGLERGVVMSLVYFWINSKSYFDVLLLVSCQLCDTVSSLGFRGEDGQLTDGVQVKELLDEGF